MGTKTFNNYEDLLTFTRASKGHALRPVSYGDEIFGNSGFDDTSEWTLALDSISISNGKLIYDGTNNIRGADQQVSVEAGKIYQLSFEVLSGTARLYLSEGYASTSLISDLAAANYGVGKHVVNVVANGSYDEIGFSLSKFSGGTACEIDDFSLKEVTFDESDGTLTLFEHPNNVPRVEYDADRNRLGLLVEEARTNLAVYSEDLSQLTKVNSPTITTDIATAPDGTETVDGIQDASGGSFKRAKMFQGAVSANSTQTGSLFVKKETAETNYGGVTLNFTGGTSKVCYGIIDAVNGTITAPSSGNSITPTFTTTEIGEFWRFSITATDTGSNTQLEFGVYGTLSTNGTTVGSGAGSVRRIWGAQVEAGSFPTSYIKTTGATATRSADVASIPVADFGYNQSAFTVFIEASHLYDTFPTFNRFWELHGGGDSLGLYGNAGGSSYVSMTVGGVSQINFSDGAEAAAAANTFMKYGIGLKANDFDIARDGSLDVGDTSVTMPNAIDNFNIGKANNNAAILNGHIKSIKYYPRRLTNAQLQDITS